MYEVDRICADLVCSAYFACGEIQSSVIRSANATSFAKGGFWLLALIAYHKQNEQSVK